MKKICIPVVLLTCVISISFSTTSFAAVKTPNSINVQELDIIAPEELQSGDFPQDEETILPEDLFGGRNAYIHPFLSVTVKHSDNIFRDKENTVSDWSSVLSPGLWMAFPGTDKIILSVSSSTAQPGGLSMFLEKPESFSRYQAYAFYGADIEYFSEYDDRDNTKQTANAFFQYNFRGGLSFNIYDKWVDSEDPLRFRDDLILDKYMSNLLGVIVDYDISEKLNLRLDLNNYYLEYEEAENAFKDRTDNALSLYGFFEYSPKTSFFGELRYINIEHDLESSPDSDQTSFYGGTNWNPTLATKLMAKIGIENKDFDEDDNVTEFGFEAQVRHDFTDKTSLTLFGAQKLNETKISNTTYQLMRVIDCTYNQTFTEKLSGNITLGAVKNEYRGGTNERDDLVYNFEPGVQFMVKRWMILRAWYAYTERDSDVDIYDYTENAFYLSLSVGM